MKLCHDIYITKLLKSIRLKDIVSICFLDMLFLFSCTQVGELTENENKSPFQLSVKEFTPDTWEVISSFTNKNSKIYVPFSGQKEAMAEYDGIKDSDYVYSYNASTSKWSFTKNIMLSSTSGYLYAFDCGDETPDNSPIIGKNVETTSQLEDC